MKVICHRIGQIQYVFKIPWTMEMGDWDRKYVVPHVDIAGSVDRNMSL